MAGSWRIITHPKGEWIIQSGRARCAVSPDLGRALLPLAGQVPDEPAIRRQLSHSSWIGCLDDRATDNLSQGLAKILAGPGTGRKSPGSQAVWLRLPLIPAGATARVARWMRGLTATPSLAGLALIGGGLYLVAGLKAPLTWPDSSADIALGLGLFFLLGVFHELGHAAALGREGYLPGGIGLGVLFVIPVLFADVSAVALLPRGGKLRVDLAGVCFQLGAGGVLLAAGALNPHLSCHGALQLAGLLGLAAVAWSLLPFIRADGYWFLSDLLGLVNLEMPAPAGRGPALLIFLFIHRLANAAFLILIGIALPLRYLGYLTFLARKAGLPAAIPLVILTLLMGLVWFGMGRRLFILIRSCKVDLGHLLIMVPRIVKTDST